MPDAAPLIPLRRARPLAKGHPLILVIEDELGLRRYLRRTLQSNRYRVEEAMTGPEGAVMAARLNPDLVILDLDLGIQGSDGLGVARELRGTGRVPIIVLSERDGETFKVQALDQGADDFLVKPFGSAELLARIRVALRHSAKESVPIGVSLVEIGPLRMDFLHREFTLAGREVLLTPNEIALLAILSKHPGKLVSPQRLFSSIAGAKSAGRPGILLLVQLARLSRKLEIDPAMPHVLITEPGRGYRLNVPGLTASSSGMLSG